MIKKLSEIKNIQTKEGYVSLSSNLFIFISLFASEYLISELGLNSSDSKIFNTLKSYFLSDDYPTDSYFQTLLETDSLSKLLSFFPKNKKDFSRWEIAKKYYFSSDNNCNELIIGEQHFKTKKSFLSIDDVDGECLAFRAKYMSDNKCDFVAIGNYSISIENNNVYFFDKTNITLNSLGSMQENDFFNSCEDLIKTSEEQKMAIKFSKTKNLVILAGAGSGKTRTLSSRYLYLHFVKNVPLEKLLLVTFTRRARSDMQEKTAKLYKKITNNPNAKTSQIKAKTIDSFFRYLITTFYDEIGFTNKPDFRLDIKNKENYKRIISEIIINNRLERSFFKDGKVDISNYFIKNLDTHMRSGKSIDSNYDVLAKLVTSWQLEHNSIYTFSSASLILFNALSKNKVLVEKINSLYEYVLIDEFQDINDIQDSIFKKMYEDERVHFTFVGDDDQSIYFWRGSNNEIIKAIGKRNDTSNVFLNTNYRNNPYIVKAGNAVLSKIDSRSKKDKDIIPYQTTGSKIRIVNIANEYSKLALEIKSLIESGKKPGKIAVLSRMGISHIGDSERKPLDYLIDALKNASVPFEIRTQEAEFTPVYDILKFLLVGLSKSETSYGLANQILENMSSIDCIDLRNEKYLTASMLNELVFHDGYIDKNKLCKKCVEYLEKIIQLKTSIENSYDSDLEEILNRFLLSASKLFMYSNENVLLDLPIFKGLINYSINNPVKWPCTKDKIEDFFHTYEENLELISDIDDINTEDLSSVKVSTIHSFKGLEFDVVFVIGLNEGVFPDTDKLLRERQRKEKELKILIEESKKLQEVITPSIKSLYSDVLRKSDYKCPSSKFIKSLSIFKEYIQDEANFDLAVNSINLENYGQAFYDYIMQFVDRLRDAISKENAELSKIDYDFNRFMESKALKASPEETDRLKELKLKEISNIKKPILEKMNGYDKTLVLLMKDIDEAKRLYDLSLVALGCLENISKINELENYIKQLDYELDKKIEEERKLFYVAITRPSDILYLVYSSSSDDSNKQSEFIKEIPSNLVMKYKIESLQERKEANKSIRELEKIYDTSNGGIIDDKKQIEIINSLTGNKIFRTYLKKMEIKFFIENPIFNLLVGNAREYFTIALDLFFLTDYLGIDFTAEFLFNIQRSVEEFMDFMTGEKAQYPEFSSKPDDAIDIICKVLKGCITNPPTHEEIRKLLMNNSAGWSRRLKKVAIIHYYVRSGKFKINPAGIENTFKYSTMKNDSDIFLRAIIDLSNYRNSFIHDHKPVWNGDPKEDTLNFYRTIIQNFYDKTDIDTQTNENASMNTIDDFDEIENENFDKPAKIIFKSSIGKILEINAKMKNGTISMGTGFIVNNNYVLTNAHVVSSIDENNHIFISNCVECNFYLQSAKIKASILFSDKKTDIALLKLDEKQLFPGLVLSFIPLEIGETVYTIGNTKGEGLCLLDGIVSDTKRKVFDNECFMFNAMISNGNSGGPILNTRGEVVGIASAGDKEVKSMNYGIPVKTIRYILKKNGFEV